MHEGMATAPWRAIAVAVTGMMVRSRGDLKFVALSRSRSMASATDSIPVLKISIVCFFFLRFYGKYLGKIGNFC
jgi:hypothetical protein